jgi:hypothetical protein
MRLARLLVACLAFALARPVPAAPGAFDGIALVASASLPNASPASANVERTSSSEARVLARRTLRFHDVLHDGVRALAQLQSPRALVVRKYLRNCSLLC